MIDLRIGLICCLLVVYAAAKVENGGVNFEVGGKKDDANIKRLYDTLSKTPDDSESGDGSGDDDTEIYSGSGSGEPEPVTEKPATDSPTTKVKTKPPTKQTKSPPSSTMVMINEVETTKKAKTTDEKDENENEIIIGERPTKEVEDPSNKVGASHKDDDKGDKSNKTAGGIDFTVGIIVGVVVGAILAILVIVFLVYRLRKKDEGSYSLDEPSSVAFIRDEKNGGGQEKEYFA